MRALPFHLLRVVSFSAIALLASHASAQPRTVTGPFFRLSLPAHWVEVSSTRERVVYRNDIEMRQLTISTLEIAQPLSEAEFSRIFEHRIAAERRELGAAGLIDVGAVERSPTVQRILYFVKEASPPRYAVGALVAIPTRVVTFYVESISGSYESHIKVARAILDTAQAR